MKKILLLATLFSTATFANTWEHMQFPKKSPIYHSVETLDTSKEVTLSFACLDGINQKVVNLSNVMVDAPEGTLKFYPSSKDKISKIIEGKYKVNESNTIDVLLGEEPQNLMSYFKLLHEVNLDIKTNKETNINFTFNLKGSSKNLNIFDSRCEKMSKK